MEGPLRGILAGAAAWRLRFHNIDLPYRVLATRPPSLLKQT